jgi:hypothetical protein
MPNMLSPEQISQIVSDVVAAKTSPSSVRAVSSEPATAFEDEEAVRITIVLTPDAVTQLAAGLAGDAVVQIMDRLRDAGEERFPLLQFATEQELEDVGDSER